MPEWRQDTLIESPGGPQVSPTPVGGVKPPSSLGSKGEDVRGRKKAQKKISKSNRPKRVVAKKKITRQSLEELVSDLVFS